MSIAAVFSGGIRLDHTLGMAFVPETSLPAQDSAATAEADSPSAAIAALQEMEPLPPKKIDAETLWLARCIYSETKRPREQELVAWVVRNRVETRYRGNDSYREAVLDPYQFSAFNPESHKRPRYLNLDRSSRMAGWQRALRVAHQVKGAPSAQRPFPKSTRHFFSERSMDGGRHPNWAARGTKVSPERYQIDEDRFRFYEDVM